MEPKTFSEIIQTPYDTENEKITTTLTQSNKGENTLNTLFDWSSLEKLTNSLKELTKLNKNIEDSDKYKGMFKNEN